LKSLRNKLLNFIFYLRSNKKIFSELNTLKDFEKKTIEENLSIQKYNLEKILKYSWQNIPYYRKVLEEAKVVINGNIHLENFPKIKILDKEILMKNFDTLISTEKKVKRNMYINYSGGSTGVPTKFIQNYNFKTLETATKWLFFTYLTDYPCKHISLWGSERDIIKKKFMFKKNLMNFLQQKLVLNSFQMTQENMINYVKKINKYKPEILESYVQPIYELAQFIRRNNLEIIRLKGIITTAGTLYPEMKELIEEVFQCPVLNRYGTREAGDIACSCCENQGLHVNVINNYLEILDDNLNPVKPGEIGQIYITKLTNYSMPLIRYKIGDLGILSEEISCKCGRGFPLIKFIEGREMCVFRTRQGRIIPTEFFIHFIGVVFNQGIITKFQIIQNEYEKITIKYILESNIKRFENNKQKIDDAIKKVMGENCEIIWQEVHDIPNLPSGKYLYSYSEIS